MTAPPSFERFDYLLRSNKQIERKLLFDLLVRSRKFVKYEQYRYLGLGSMWFIDHRMAHRLLGIEKLYSIEKNEHAPRAKFNRPYGCIEVWPGDASAVLANMSVEDWAQPYVVWLDYDGALLPSIVGDTELALNRLQPGSVIAVTVNAEFGTYRKKQNAIDAAKAAGRDLDPRSVATLTTLLGNVVPQEFLRVDRNGKPTDVSESEFPHCLAASLLAFFAHKVVVQARQAEGARLSFAPLFSFSHKDGAWMVTVGGALCTDEQKPLWTRAVEEDPIVAQNGGTPMHHALDMIPITLREKLLMDGLLPTHSQTEFVAAAADVGLKISERELEKYRLHYRHVPVFIESLV